MIKLSLVLGCLCLAVAAVASPPPSSAPPAESTLLPPSDVPPGAGPTQTPPWDVPPGTGSIPPLQPGPIFSPPHDWLSDDVGRITYYGPYGYPIWEGFYDYRIFYDEWYPVARSFLDGTSYRTYYYTGYRPIYMDGSWWKDPRGYRPSYKIRSGFSFSGA